MNISQYCCIFHFPYLIFDTYKNKHPKNSNFKLENLDSTKELSKLHLDMQIGVAN